jgi:hypothetical protein
LKTLFRSSPANSNPDAIPNQPVFIQIVSAVSLLEAPSSCVGRGNIHADPRRFLLSKPCGQKAKHTDEMHPRSAVSALEKNLEAIFFP